MVFYFQQECLEIFELPDLSREYELAAARAKLINCPPGKFDVEEFLNLHVVTFNRSMT